MQIPDALPGVSDAARALRLGCYHRGWDHGRVGPRGHARRMAGAMAEADVVVLGAGTNGLTAAALLARTGLQVLVLEANATIGGAVRTAEVTLPGFRHDLYSGFYPLFPVGPIGQLPLERYGLTLCQFEYP